MLTPFSTIYKRFLDKIKDITLVKIIEEDVEIAEDMLKNYLISAVSHFTYSTKDLSKRDEEGFQLELTDLEIEILALFMTYVYLNQHVISSDKITERLTPKDFKVYSTANLISEVRKTQEMIYERAVQLMVENHYRVEY